MIRKIFILVFFTFIYTLSSCSENIAIKEVREYQKNKSIEKRGNKLANKLGNKYRSELENKEIELPELISKKQERGCPLKTAKINPLFPSVYSLNTLEKYKLTKTKMKFFVKIITEKYFNCKIRITEMFKHKEHKNQVLQIISDTEKEIQVLRVLVNSTKIYNFYSNYKIFISLINNCDIRIRRLEKTVI